MPPCQVCAQTATSRCSRCRSAYFCSPACQSSAWSTHKGICKRLATNASVGGPSEAAVVLIIGELKNNFHSRHADLLSELQRRSTIVITQKVTVGMTGLDLQPQAIVLADDGILQQEWQSVLMRSMEMSKTKGCRLVLGADCAAMASRLDNIFAILRVPWRYKDYFRTEFEVSVSCTAPLRQTIGLTPSYSMKASQLAGVNSSDALYIPVPGARLQSMVFLDELVAGKAGCAAAYMKYGNGWLGFSGDNNQEGASVKLEVAMCGLTLEDCSLGDQTDANSTPAALPGRPNVTIAYSGLAGVNRAHNPDPSRMSVASDIDFWMRPGLRFSTDTTPRQSRWDPNRQMQSFPGMPA